MGFKTAVLEEVTVNAGVPASVRVVLEVGELQETVVVQGESAAVVQTQRPAVSTTLNIREVSNLPLVSRNALDFVVMLPGVNTPGGNRDSTINGLPQHAINITIDGINVQDNTLKSTDGFFTIVQPRLDAIEEVTLTTAGENAGQGAVQIQFVTRSGTNEWRGSVYHYLRHDALNANTWFNERAGIPKPKLKQDQPGRATAGARPAGPPSQPRRKGSRVFARAAGARLGRASLAARRRRDTDQPCGPAPAPAARAILRTVARSAPATTGAAPCR